MTTTHTQTYKYNERYVGLLVHHRRRLLARSLFCLLSLFVSSVCVCLWPPPPRRPPHYTNIIIIIHNSISITTTATAVQSRKHQWEKVPRRLYVCVCVLCVHRVYKLLQSVFCVCSAVHLIISENLLGKTKHAWGSCCASSPQQKGLQCNCLKDIYSKKKNAAATIQMKQIHWKFTKLVCRGNTVKRIIPFLLIKRKTVLCSLPHFLNIF